VVDWAVVAVVKVVFGEAVVVELDGTTVVVSELSFFFLHPATRIAQTAIVDLIISLK
jgi:hypothetical protein